MRAKVALYEFATGRMFCTICERWSMHVTKSWWVLCPSCFLGGSDLTVLKNSTIEAALERLVL
jgi:hypothetical protein